MNVKIFRGVWMVSLLATFAVLMYIYASLPESVLLGDGPEDVEVSRNTLFYVLVFILAIPNATAFGAARLFERMGEKFLIWFKVEVTLLNLFFIVALQLINLLNGQEKFDFERIGVVVYTSVFVFVLWTVGWPIYALYERAFSKQPV